MSSSSSKYDLFDPCRFRPVWREINSLVKRQYPNASEENVLDETYTRYRLLTKDEAEMMDKRMQEHCVMCPCFKCRVAADDQVFLERTEGLCDEQLISGNCVCVHCNQSNDTNHCKGCECILCEKTDDTYEAAITQFRSARKLFLERLSEFAHDEDNANCNCVICREPPSVEQYEAWARND